MFKKFDNRFFMNDSCTGCTESASASSFCASQENCRNNALLLMLDTVIAVSIFALISLVSAVIGISAVILSAVIVIFSALSVILLFRFPFQRRNKALTP